MSEKYVNRGARAEFKHRTRTDHEVQVLIQEFEDGDEPCHWAPSQILNMLARYVDQLDMAKGEIEKLTDIAEEQERQIFYYKNNLGVLRGDLELLTQQKKQLQAELTARAK
jgi:hypothetical protein